MAKHKQQFISIGIRLVALLIMIIYLLISQLYLRERNETKFNTVEKENLSDNYRAAKNKTEPNEIEMNIWVRQKFSDYKREYRKYTVPEEKIVITVDNKEIQESMKIKQLEDMGWNINVPDMIVYGLGEVYGNIMEYGDTLVTYSCLNTSAEDKLLRDCILTQYILEDNFNIKLGDDILVKGCSREEVLDVLNKYNYNIQYEKVDDYCNFVTSQQGRWMISINVFKETSLGLLKSLYIMSGTDDNGLEQIKLDLNVITEAQLKDLYSKRST